MSSLSIKNISKAYADNPPVIADMNLDIRDGEFMVFVGPSGCGKTTLLRMIAGLEDISAGEIYFDDECVNDISPALRGAAMVFQSYALYPHMTVAENMSFSLKLSGASKLEQQQAVNLVADVLQIKPLLHRKPKALSGGQRQRVAIGRAIVRKPKVFLFDEPLSNLDANLRVQMRVELTRLHRELGTTMIYVTHDQVEAMTLGQRIAVFHAGKIEQVGTPLELYHKPANLFVAEFMGSPKINVLPCECQLASGAAEIMIAQAGRLLLPNNRAHLLHATHAGIRAEHLHIAEDGSGLAATVSLIEQLGDSTIVYALIEGTDKEVAARMNGSVHGVQIGQPLRLGCQPENILLFDAQGKSLKVLEDS